jgi:hypothetical protein
MHAPPKPDYPVLAPNDLAQFDAVLFGIPTRYGNFPAQWKVGISVYKEMKPSAKKALSYHRPSGMLPASYGNRASFMANMLDSSCPLPVSVVDRSRLRLPLSRLCLTTA